MIAIRLLPPIVVTLPLFPLADYLGLSDTHVAADPALRHFLGLALHDDHEDLHRRSAARTRRGRLRRRRERSGRRLDMSSCR